MVDIYYARAGFGASEYLKDELKALSASNERVYLIVPEQLSITREQWVNEQGLANVNVYSFSRLANTVFRALGGTAKKNPDKVMSASAAFCAVQNKYPNLSFYKRAAFTHGFITQLMAAFSEFDNNCVDFNRVMQIPDSDFSARSKAKYGELFMLYNEFKSLWKGEYKAPNCEILEASALLELGDIFNGAVFAFDGFFGFTPQQLKIITQILLQAKRAIFAFTTDLKSEIFETVTTEVKKIKRLCKKSDIDCFLKDVTSNFCRFKADGIKNIEKYAFDDVLQNGTKNADGVTVYGAKNITDELNFIACKIKNDVLNKKYDFNDIAVLCPDSESVRFIAASVFEKHGVPAFIDTGKTLLEMPLCAFVTTAFDIANDGFEFENVFAFLKTGLLGISFDDISLIENYVRMWKIRGGTWAQDRWTNNPNGLGARVDESTDARLNKINDIKNAVYPPLKKFCDAVRGKKSAGVFLKAIFELCQDFDVCKNLDATAKKFYDTGDIQLYYEYTRVYSVFMGMLDSLYIACGDTEFESRRFYDMLCVAAGAVNVMGKPARTNEVLFASLGRVRADNKKCVYIMQLNSDKIPSAPSSNSLITEADKRVFSAYDIEVSMDFETASKRECFDFYFAVTSPSDELVLSYSSFTQTGQMLEKSEYLETIMQTLGAREITRADLDDKFYLVSLAGAQEIAPKHKGVGDALRRISGVEFTKKQGDTTLADSVVEGLYKRELRLSFSGMEEFVNCPFKFFLNHGLRLGKTEPVEFNPANIGTFIHKGLENLLSGQYDISTDKAVKAAVDKISDDYYNIELADCKNRSKRFDYLFARAKYAFEGAAKNIADEIKNSDFKPYEFEVDISKFTKPLELENGYKLMLVGSIDRVDLTDDGYVKIIDYKSGSQKFSFEKIYNGLSLQLPVYASAILAKSPDYKIAAMYYLKVGVATAPDLSFVPISDEQYRQQLDKYYTRDGIFCDDQSAVSKLDKREEFLSSIKKDRLIGEQKIKALIDFTNDKIRQTGKGITLGNTNISPICHKDIDTCKYCDYASICGIDEQEDKKRELKPLPVDFLGGECDEQ